MKLTLTEGNKFIAHNSVWVLRDFWRTILQTATQQLNGADRGEYDADHWKFFLQELAAGCKELITNDNFLRIVAIDENHEQQAAQTNGGDYDQKEAQENGETASQE